MSLDILPDNLSDWRIGSRLSSKERMSSHWWLPPGKWIKLPNNCKRYIIGFFQVIFLCQQSWPRSPLASLVGHGILWVPSPLWKLWVGLPKRPRLDQTRARGTPGLIADACFYWHFFVNLSNINDVSNYECTWSLRRLYTNHYFTSQKYWERRKCLI